MNGMKHFFESRSVTPVRNRHDKFARSRSRTPPKRHSRRYSPSRSRSRSYGRYRSKRDKRYRSPSISPMSRRRRHDGDRENPKESKCLGIFGMSLETDERKIKEIFEHYGPVEEIQIVKDYHTGRSRGFGFVYLKYIEDAIDAKENIPGLEIDGKKVRVDFSITKRAHTPTPGTYLGDPGGRTDSSRNHRSPSHRGRYRSHSRSRSRGRY